MIEQNVRLYFDVTQTLKTSFTSGIQRVVIEWAKGIVCFSDELNLDCFFVYFDNNSKSFKAIAHDDFFRLIEDSRGFTSNSKSFIGKFLTKTRPYISDFLPVKLLDFFSGVYDRNFLNPLLREKVRESKVITVSKQDLFFSADAFWNNRNESMYIMEHVPSESLILFVHDLLPLTHPEFFDKRAIKLFKDNCIPLVLKSRIVLCATRFVHSELVKIGVRESIIQIVKLGSTIEKFPQVNFASHNTQSPPYRVLAVGTIEPRKNYLTILDWFSETDLDVELRIVGRQGWKSKNILQRIRRLHAKNSLNNKFVWFPQVSDFELERHYAWAEYGICASLAEGFGLPLREFLVRGIPVSASSIPPFKEISSNSSIRFFDPFDSSDLDIAMRGLIANSFVGDFIVNTWEESGRELAELLTSSHIENFNQEGLL